MKFAVGDLNLRISNQVAGDPPRWFNQNLEFDFPIQVQAGNIVQVTNSSVVVWLWKSYAPAMSERRVGEVRFRNEGSDLLPQITSESTTI
jgi:hypothetical protein